MTEATQDQMPLDRAELADLEVVHPQLCLAVLEGPFDDPAGERHPQQRLDRRRFRGVAEEVFHFGGIQRVACDQQMVRPRRQAFFIRQIDHQPLGLPNHRAFATIFDVIVLPGDLPQQRRIGQDVSDLHLGVVPGFEPSRPTRPARLSLAGMGPIQHCRTLRPHGKAGRHLGDVVLPQALQFPQKRPFAAVAFIERQPGEMQAVGERPLILLQRDLPFGPIDDLVGNPRRLTTRAVVVPCFLGQIQFAVDEAIELGRRIAQMHADHAVLDLAHRAAVLALDAGGHLAFLDETGLIDNADALAVGVPAGDMLLEPVPDRRLIPAVQAQELLQIARRHAERIGHGLDALTRQIAQLPLDVQVEITSAADPAEVGIELFEETRQFRLELHNRTGVHTDDLPKETSFPWDHRLAA